MSVETLVNELREKNAKCDKLYSELQVSLAIKAWWPEAFEHGTVKSCWFGSPANGFRFRVTRGDGEMREVAQADAPEFAGPGPSYAKGKVTL